MKEIIFVAHNQVEVASAQKAFINTKLEFFNHDIDKTKSEDLKEVVTSKVKQAYKITQRPCMTQEVEFFIDALSSFPKSFVSFTLENLGIEGILKLMNGISDRKCSFKEYLAYYDGNEIKYFEGNHEGVLSEEILGVNKKEQCPDLWYIFKPYGYELTLAEMPEEMRDFMDINEHNTSAVTNFAKWFED